MKPTTFTTEFFVSSLPELQARGLEDENLAPHGSDLIERELERYYELINRARENLGGLFTDSERRVLVEMANGLIFEPAANIDKVPEEVMHFLERNAWARENVDPNVLMTKLDTLSRVALFAVVDAVERHWAVLQQQGCADLDDLFRAVDIVYR